MTLNELMKEYAAAGEIPEIKPGEDGVYVLRFDGDISVALREWGDEKRMVVWSRVGFLPADGREEFFAMLLRASARTDDGRTPGMAFSVDGEEVFVHRTEWLVSMDLRALAELIEDVKFAVGDWRTRTLLFRPGANRPETLEDLKRMNAEARQKAETPEPPKDAPPTTTPGGSDEGLMIFR